MLKFWLICGALFAFLAVAFGAFGAHGLRKKIAPEMLSSFETAIRYQMYHALALVSLVLLQFYTHDTSFDIAGWAFVVGTLLFSGSLYMHALTGTKWLAGVAPVGGIILLIGWGWMIYQVVRWLPQ